MITQANALHLPIASNTVQTVVTSPPYFGQRDYGTATWIGGDPACDHKKGKNAAKSEKSSTLEGSKRNTGNRLSGFTHSCPRCGAQRVDLQLGLEQTPAEYIANMVAVFEEVKRVMRPDGTLWLNIGDKYSTQSAGTGGPSKKQLSNAGSQAAPDRPGKNLLGLPWRVAFAMQDAGWILRRDIIWFKTNPMPESAQDRPTTSHEYLFLFSKSPDYFYDNEAVKVPSKAVSIDRYYRKWSGQTKNAGGDPDSVQASALAKNYAARSQRDNFKRASKEAEVPTNGTLQHRDEREESDYDLTKRSLRSVWEFEQDEYSQFLEWKAAREDQPQDLLDVWKISTQGFSGSHFATYPEKLVEPCILAGSSARGCCPKCRAPYERITERGPVESTDGTADNYAPPKNTEDERIKGRSDGWAPNHQKKTKTTGWQPTCECYGILENHYQILQNEDGTKEKISWVVYVPSREVDQPAPIPCIVLDPFSGSGATGRVAARLGRNYVGVEINWDYIKMRKERLTVQVEMAGLR